MAPKLQQLPGYSGLVCTDTADGAHPNGTRVRKRRSEDGDAHPDGSLGTVLGSLDGRVPDPRFAHIRHAYFVEWDASPRVAVGVIDAKVELAEEQH